MGAIRPGSGVAGGATVPSGSAGDLVVIDGAGTLDKRTPGATGSSLIAAATAAAARALLYPATPVDLTISAGWTARAGAGSGTAAVNTGASRIDLSCSSGAGEVFASIGHAPWSTEPGIDLRARLRSFTGDGIAAHYAHLSVADDLAQTVFAGLEIFDDDTARAIGPGGSGTAYPVAGVTGGQGWGRIVYRGGRALVYAGVGSGGAQPTSWTPLGEVAATAPVAPWVYTVFQAGRAGGVGGDVAAQWSDISYTEAAP